jgi:hypothetical protein
VGTNTTSVFIIETKSQLNSQTLDFVGFKLIIIVEMKGLYQLGCFECRQQGRVKSSLCVSIAKIIVLFLMVSWSLFSTFIS